MKCPHCLVEVNPHFAESFLGNDVDGSWSVFYDDMSEFTMQEIYCKIGKRNLQDKYSW